MSVRECIASWRRNALPGMRAGERTTDGWAQLLDLSEANSQKAPARLWLSGYRKRQEQWRGAWPIGSVARFSSPYPCNPISDADKDGTSPPALCEMKVVNVHAFVLRALFSASIEWNGKPST